MSAFSRGIGRAIRSSLGRFLAIMGIVALGCGFFAGMRMGGSGMRAAADAYYDDAALWDLRVVSTQGLGERDVERLAEVAGVSGAVGSTSVDVMARMGSEQVAARVSSLPAEYVGGSSEPRVNRLVLRDGRWPSEAEECVASADNPALPVEPGDVVEVLREAGDAGTLVTDELTVVGTVSSSMYPYTVTFGSTTLGSGVIDQYLYVPASAFSEDAPYTEAYLRVAGAEDEESGSAAYEAAVGAVADRIEGDAPALAEARLADVRADAQGRVDEAREDYEDERASAEAELADGRAELDEALSLIESGEARVADGEAGLAAARSELEASRAEADSQISSARDQLDASQAALDAQVAELDARAGDAETARAAYDQGLEVLLASLAEQGVEAADLDGAVAALGAARDELASAREAVVGAISQLEAAQEEAEAAGGELPAEQLGQLEAARAQLAQIDARAQSLESASASASELASARDAVSAYDAGRARAADAQAEIDVGRAELAARERAADSQLAAAQAQIDASAAELASARAELDAARDSYEEGLAAWEEARAEADERLADAASQLDEAQAEVDALEPGDIYVLDRTQNEGTASYQADSERIDKIATVFPLMFFLVAALVSLTTMTRMVEDERGVIGTLKALGYGMARIASRYLAYAGLAATAGAVLGILVLSQVLPLVVMSAYQIIYAVPLPSPPLSVDPAVALSSAGLGVGVTLAATWAAVAASLREPPAALMLPRAPKPGRRILLERIRPLWRRLSFLRKVTARNLFRYKRRLLMTVVGISGCTALLLVGFGLHDAIWDIIDNQFGPIVRYDTAVSLDEGATADEVDAVAARLVADGRATDLAHAATVNLQLSSPLAGGPVSAQLIVPEDVPSFESALDLHDRLSGEGVPLEGKGVVLAEKTAAKLGVSVGDEVVLRAQDAVGNAVGEGRALTVSGVVENYVGDLAYLAPEAWDTLRSAGVVDDEEPSFSTIYASTDDDPSYRAGLADELAEAGPVSTVAFVDETVGMYRDMLSAVDMIVVVLIVSAAALAFIVLYNLANINVDERVREIATLKVLGFRRGEVAAYVFREIFVLALLGDVLGLVLGTWLEGFVIVTAEVDLVMFGRVIHLASYACAFVLTLVFAGLVMLAMRRKLDGVDMVESLKSVD